jgi:hypothetical protein
LSDQAAGVADAGARDFLTLCEAWRN